MKLFVCVCCAGDGRVGYVAAMVCRSVHVLRPSSSTSAGQSDGASAGRSAVVLGAACLEGFWPLVICIQSFTLVHVRHLVQESVARSLTHYCILTACHPCLALRPLAGSEALAQQPHRQKGGHFPVGALEHPYLLRKKPSGIGRAPASLYLSPA